MSEVKVNIREQLNALWAERLEDIQFSLVAHSISVKFKNEREKIHSTLTFENVNSYIFIDPLQSEEAWDYVELTSIDYYPKGLCGISFRHAQINN